MASGNTSLETRIRRVCAHVERHLDDPPDLDALSALAALSRFHFQRVFAAHVGIGPGRFIALARLRRAAYKVAFEPELRLIDIGLEAGFDSPEAFARAFRRHFGQSPSQFRAAPDWPRWHASFQINSPTHQEDPMQIDIIDFEETPVARIEHRGAPERVLETAARFIAWRKATGLSPVASARTFGVPYADPAAVMPEDFRFDICGSEHRPIPENEWGVVTGVIPGGRCARVRHLGSHDRIDQSIYPLYRDWLPHSGETLRDFPVFFHYLNLIHEVDECDLITDIYLPLR